MFATASSHHHDHDHPKRRARLATARRAQRRWMAAFWLMCLAVLLAAMMPRTAAAADIRWTVGVQIGEPGWGVSIPVRRPAPVAAPVVVVPVGGMRPWGGQGAGQLPPPMVFDAPRLAVVAPAVRMDGWERRERREEGYGAGHDGWGHGWRERPWHRHFHRDHHHGDRHDGEGQGQGHGQWPHEQRR
jgi:hypothetical protein